MTAAHSQTHSLTHSQPARLKQPLPGVGGFRQSTSPAEIIYPDSDGKPMADNTRQFTYIVTIQGGIAALFADRPDVFVAGDLLWYPVEGNPRIRAAPDTLVAFGRPPGYRGSYIQWREGGIAPQVAFEVLSPGNRPGEMKRKREFYQRYGVEEYYEYDPDRGELRGWLRQYDQLVAIADMDGWISPRLKIRFTMEDTDLVLYRPDGRRFETFLELEQRAAAAQQQAEVEQGRVAIAQQQAAIAQQQAAIAQQQAETERGRADRLAAQLRALGIDPETLNRD
jgi:Uma2 family endonuclease